MLVPVQHCWCLHQQLHGSHEGMDETVEAFFNSFFLSATACWPLIVLPLNSQIPTISTGTLLNDTKHEREEQED